MAPEAQAQAETEAQAEVAMKKVDWLWLIYCVGVLAVAGWLFYMMVTGR